MSDSQHEFVFEDDPWPEGISDGLTLPCHRCGQIPSFDYRVDSLHWKAVVPQELRSGVICLPCFGEMADEQKIDIHNAIEEVQWTGREKTVVLRPTRVVLYEPREPVTD